jgi:hypothetical protein
MRSTYSSLITLTILLALSVTDAHAGRRPSVDTSKPFQHNGRIYYCPKGQVLYVAPGGRVYCDTPPAKVEAPPVLSPTSTGISYVYPDPTACVKAYAHTQNPFRGPIGGRIIGGRINSGKQPRVRRGIDEAKSLVPVEMGQSMAIMMEEMKANIRDTFEKLGFPKCTFIPGEFAKVATEQCSSLEAKQKYSAGIDQSCAQKDQAGAFVCSCMKPSTMAALEANCKALVTSPEVTAFVQEQLKACQKKGLEGIAGLLTGKTPDAKIEE